MPEGYEKRPQIIKDLLQFKRFDPLPPNLEKAQIEFLQSDEYLGEGAESLVIIHPDNPNLIIGYVHLESSANKWHYHLAPSIIYHSHRIWSTLFPHNFPEIKFASSGPDAKTVRERIMGHTELDYETNPKLRTSKPDIKYPFNKVYEAVMNHNLPEPYIDNFESNFIISDDGGQYYVDLVVESRFYEIDFQTWDLDNLLRFLREKRRELSGSEKLKVLKSAERINQIKIAKYFIETKNSPPVDYDSVRHAAKNLGLKVSDEFIIKTVPAVQRILNKLEKIFKKGRTS